MLCLILILCVTPAASQCMARFERSTGCPSVGHGNNTHSVSTYSLLECIDNCLVSAAMCKAIKWNQLTKQCHIIKGQANFATSEGDCISLCKEPCLDVQDSRCFTEDHGPVYEDSPKLQGMEKEIECRTLCVVDFHCKAYVWNKDNLICMVQHNYGNMRPRNKLRNEVHMKKVPSCEVNRCALLKVGAYHRGAKRDNSATTINKCLERLLKRKDVFMLDWNLDSNECWLHKPNHGYFLSTYISTLRIVQVVQSKSCTKKDQEIDICVRKQERMGMVGGFVISRLTEIGCVEFCKHIANCAAVDWDNTRFQCIYHHVEKPLFNERDMTHYSITECKTYEINEDSHSSSKNTHEISAYYIRKRMLKTSARDKIPCLQCAFKCHRISCSGFTCRHEDGDNGQVCIIADVTDPMYVPLIM